MTKLIMSLLIILLGINLIITADAQVQSMSNTVAGTNASTAINATSQNKIVQILGIDSTAFPKLKINVFIDKLCAMAGNSKNENFKVKENGRDAAIDNFYFTGNASGHRLDLAVVFDDTGSMQPEIDAMKSKVKGLTDTIKASGLDANYSLVSFKDSISVKTKWTNDPTVFKKNVDALAADGGGDEPEDSMDAIEAALSMGFRPDAQKIVLVITDAHAHYKNDSSSFSNCTREEIEKDLRKSGVIFIPVSPTFDKPSKYVDLRIVANDIQSIWIDMKSANFSTILEQFKGIITGNYVIEYTSPDQTTFGNRNVTVTVEVPGCVADSASSSYSVTTPNAPPIINDLVAEQSNGTAITWIANATDLENDPIVYRFFFNNKTVTEWIKVNKWILNTLDADVGNNTIEVQIRDGKHEGIDSYDDFKTVQFTLSSMKLMSQKWEKTFGGSLNDRTFSVQQTSDGGYILAGWTNSSGAGGEDAWLIKTDLLGNKEWEKTFGGSGLDNAKSVQQTGDGGYILAGYTTSYGTGSGDAWLIKTDSSGNKEWDKTFGGSGANGATSVHQTSDGGYIIVGHARGSGIIEPWLIKTDASGNKVWDKTLGGSALDEETSVQQTSDGGYIIAGYGYSFGSGIFESWLIKTDSLGNKVWDKTFDGYWANSVQQTSDGGFIIAGLAVSSGAGHDDGWLMKTDSSGNKKWDKILVVSAFDDFDDANSVQQTSDGGYIIAGGTNSSVARGSGGWLIKTDSYGNKVWDKTFGGSALDEADSVQQTIDGGYIIAGDTNSFGAGGSDGWLIKTDANGNT